MSRRIQTLRLYRHILQAHRRLLPAEERALGDNYVKEEWRLHKKVPIDSVKPFLSAWKHYLHTLRAQEHDRIGRDLRPEQLESLSLEQKKQLEQLHRETEEAFAADVSEEVPSDGPPSQADQERFAAMCAADPSEEIPEGPPPEANDPDGWNDFVLPETIWEEVHYDPDPRAWLAPGDTWTAPPDPEPELTPEQQEELRRDIAAAMQELRREMSRPPFSDPLWDEDPEQPSPVRRGAIWPEPPERQTK